MCCLISYLLSWCTCLVSSEEIGKLKATEVQIIIPPSVPVRLLMEYKNLPYAEIVHLVQQRNKDIFQEVLNGPLEQSLTLHRTSSRTHTSSTLWQIIERTMPGNSLDWDLPCWSLGCSPSTRQQNLIVTCYDVANELLPLNVHITCLHWYKCC